MVKFDNSRLSTRVAQDFMSFASHLMDAEAMNAFADAVRKNAVGTVRELMHAFNEASFIARVPPEILAACFAHLHFSHRISLSRVCRSWRAAALSAPELWSNIRLWSPFSSPKFLNTALSRAGALPIYMSLDSRPTVAPEDIYSAIAPFSRQIRYLAWHSKQPVTPWDFPAPNMECFCTTQTITITDRFLGGDAGRLRYLYLQCAYLPATCPVLSTVTDLSIVLSPFGEGVPPSTLTNLFALFPRLEWLQMLGISDFAAHMLPVGRAPVSLRELSLQSMSWDYDLTPLYVAWDSGNLDHVSLSQYPGVPPNLERLARGTVRLAVRYDDNTSATRLLFEHSATVSHSVEVSEFKIADVVTALSAVQSDLITVHTAMISHVALRPLSNFLTALPNLENLFVHIVPETEDDDIYPSPGPAFFMWTRLSCLADLARSMARLRTITLHVWCAGFSRPTTEYADDAEDLISRLRALPGALPPVEIQGFPAESVADLDLNGLDVRFDFVAQVGDLRFHQDREAWDPCW